MSAMDQAHLLSSGLARSIVLPMRSISARISKLLKATMNRIEKDTGEDTFQRCWNSIIPAIVHRFTRKPCQASELVMVS